MSGEGGPDGRALRKAEWHLSAGRAREALDALRDADPADPGVACARSRALLTLGRAGEAEEAARQGLELAPEDLRLLQALAVAQLVTDAAAAQATAERALELAPEDPYLLNLNVVVLTARGRLEAAERMLARLMQIAPEEEPTRRARATFLMRWGREPGTWSDAADELLRLEPDDAFAHHLKGMAELPERWWVGLRHLRQAAVMAPHDPLIVETARVMRSWLVRPVHPIATPAYNITFLIAGGIAIFVKQEWVLPLLGGHFAALALKALVLAVARRAIDRRVARASREP